MFARPLAYPLLNCLYHIFTYLLKCCFPPTHSLDILHMHFVRRFFMFEHFLLYCIVSCEIFSINLTERIKVIGKVFCLQSHLLTDNEGAYVHFKRSVGSRAILNGCYCTAH